MILDAHTHIFRTWPWQPMEHKVAYPNSRGIRQVPDPLEHGAVSRLIFELDMNDVARAAVVCVSMNHNQDNNDYAAACVRRYPDRLILFADIDGHRSATYHAPGAAERLESAARRYNLVGFAHYIASGDDGSWYLSQEGLDLFTKAVELGLLASIACPNPERLQPVMRQVAARFPALPLVFHQLGLDRSSLEPPYLGLREVLASACQPNIYLKLSGLHHLTPVPWEFPYPDLMWVVRCLYEHYGPDRLCWGSDSPLVRHATNYRQSIEFLRTYCSFIPDDHRARILGKNFLQLLSGVES